MYNYLEEMKALIVEDLNSEDSYFCLDEYKNSWIYGCKEMEGYDKNSLLEGLNDYFTYGYDLTGNTDGSFTFNSAVAESYVIDNCDLLKEACYELCVSNDTVASKFLDQEWEFFDVIIRVYLLPRAINEAVSEMGLI